MFHDFCRRSSSPGAEDAQTSTQAAEISSLLAGGSGRFHGRCGGLRTGLEAPSRPGFSVQCARILPSYTVIGTWISQNDGSDTLRVDPERLDRVVLHDGLVVDNAGPL